MKMSAKSGQLFDLWKSSLCALFFLAVVAVDMPVSAAGLGEGICVAVQFMTGPVGKAIATAGIIVIAVGALLGRVSWGMAVMIAAGIAGIFGAPTIAAAIAKGASDKAGESGFC